MTSLGKEQAMRFFEYVCPVGHMSHVLAASGAPAPAFCVRCEDEAADERWVEAPARATHIPVVTVDASAVSVPVRLGAPAPAVAA